jgi:hypothetical protein
MELYAIAALAAAGYYINQRLRGSPADAQQQQQQQQQQQAQAQQAQQRASADAAWAEANDRPSSDTLYDSWRVDAVLRDQMRRAKALAEDALDPRTTGVVERGGEAVRGGGDYVHSALLGVDVPMEHFQHNNMKPFFRGASTNQPMADDAFTSTVEQFTGTGTGAGLRPQVRRDEVGSLWQPVRQDTTPGTPDGARDAYLATMPASRNRANEAPDGAGPPLIVGRPGVAGGATGDVYYDMRAALMPPSVDVLRAASRPKLTFEGRAQGPGGAIQGAGADGTRPTLPLQAERRYQPLTAELGPGVDGLLRTTGAVLADARRPDDLRDVRGTQRASTSAVPGYVGPALGAGGTTLADAQAWMGERAAAPFRSSLGAPSPGPARLAGGGSALGNDHGRASILVYGNNRDATQVVASPAQQGNIGGAIKALIAPLQDLLRPTRREDLVDAPRAFGNVQSAMPAKLTVYDASDVARTTLRQTYVESVQATLGNLTRPGAPAQAVYFDPVDGAARTTRGEALLAEAPALNLTGGARRLIVYDPEDVARASRRQTTLAEAPALNLAGGRHAGAAHDPADVARASRKETTLVEAPALNLAGGRHAGAAHDPADAARRTGRETVAPVDTVRNPGGTATRAPVFDPAAWTPGATLKDVALAAGRGAPEDGSVGGLQDQRGGYETARYDARTTMRQLGDESGGTAYGQAAPRAAAGLGYTVAPADLRDTQRQVFSDLDYFGPGGGGDGTTAPTSYSTYDSFVVHGARDVTLRGRAPTDSAAKAGAAREAMGAFAVHSKAGLNFDERAPSPGRASPALPRELVGPELQMHLAGEHARRDPAEHGASQLSATRLDDEVAGAATQRGHNPFALPHLFLQAGAEPQPGQQLDQKGGGLLG